MSKTGNKAAIEEITAQLVFSRGKNMPFGELERDDVRARADELRSAAGWGPMARVVPVAQAWRELANAMERAGALAVRDLPSDLIAQLAPRLWVVPPGGSLL